MRRVFSFDVDDVISKTGYLPVMERGPESYLGAELIDSKIPSILNRLMYKNEIYFISSRSFKDSNELTRQWMLGKGIDLGYMAGLMCNVVPVKKAELCNLLHVTYHFDDNVEIVESMPNQGVAFGFWNDGEGKMRCVPDWVGVEQMCNSLPPLHIAYAPQQGRLWE